MTDQAELDSGWKSIGVHAWYRSLCHRALQEEMKENDADALIIDGSGNCSWPGLTGRG